MKLERDRASQELTDLRGAILDTGIYKQLEGVLSTLSG